MRKILAAEIPLWTATIILIIATAVSAFFYVRFYQQTIYNYVLKTPLGDSRSEALVYGPQPSLSNENFFNSVKSSFSEQKASFVEANLSDMRLRVYKDGSVVKEVEIKAKGREGSWWETPAGLYKIETKEENHFSSFGRVYQPWSMAFQGNFFIHGWPYYPDGEPVASSFSGGCIRLSDEDAEAVFSLVEKGMPVLVFEKDFQKDDFSYETKRPSVTAKRYLAADLGSNFVFLEHGSREQFDMGTLTELVTALISAEYVNLDMSVLYKGQSVTAVNVLYPLMLESDPEAAAVFSDTLGHGYMTNLMNDKVRALGMTGTEFSNPTGDEPGNITNAEDLFSLAKYIHNNRSFIWKISTGTLNHSAYGEPVFKDLDNKNEIPGMPLKLLGGKFSEGGEEEVESYVGVFELIIRGEKRSIAIIVSDSNDAKNDVWSIAEHVIANYK